MRLPALFISHGSPMLVLEPSPARDFLASYAKTLGKPRAIVIASAHFNADRPAVVTDPRPGMIYDFGGFDRKLFEMVYPAPGEPEVAARAMELLDRAGLSPARVEQRGYDHGVWVPLMLLYPDADVPVVQISVEPRLGAAHHLAVGRALAPLADDGVLVIGSGSLTHNLQAFFRNGVAPDAPAPPWVAEFEDWIFAKATAGAVDDLVHYRERAPYARENHPSEEHLLPLHFALGAGGEGARGERVHASHRHGVLSMDTYAFA
jgi:4,5-DOPA dioxygenase extradiol